MTFLIEKPSKILEWLNAKGYSGTVEDAFITYVQSGSPLTSGSMEDHLRARLNASGYSGTMDDMLTTMFQDKTGVSNRHDAERQFFQNANLNMFGIGGIDSFTVLMLHMDGSNGSTTFTDSSTAQAPKTVTPGGDSQISTARSKFGGASALFDGVGDYLSIPDSSNLQFGNGDFTVDFWVYITDFSVGPCFYADYSTGTSDWSFMILTTSATGSWQVNVKFDDATSATVNHQTDIPANQWAHIAVVRNGTSLNIFLNGVGASSPGNIGTKTIKASVLGSWIIGKEGDFNGQYVIGNIDEFRISKGIARWTSNFTPPTQAYS